MLLLVFVMGRLDNVRMLRCGDGLTDRFRCRYSSRPDDTALLVRIASNP